jgi:hypothetical protein
VRRRLFSGPDKVRGNFAGAELGQAGFGFLPGQVTSKKQKYEIQLRLVGGATCGRDKMLCANVHTSCLCLLYTGFDRIPK